MNTKLQEQHTVIETILERHSVRQYDKGHVIPKQELDEILLAAGAAPSAWNLQHWKFLVITEEAQKEKLLPIANNQQQVKDASATIVILGDLEANKNAEAVFAGSVASGKMTEEAKNNIVQVINGVYEKVPTYGRDQAYLNASLAAMQLMLAAKAKGYDSVPMGGFQAGPLIEAFKIPARYIPVMLISIGKATGESRPSGRLGLEQTVVRETFA